jgi:hypothetical protein
MAEAVKRKVRAKQASDEKQRAEAEAAAPKIRRTKTKGYYGF